MTVIKLLNLTPFSYKFDDFADMHKFKGFVIYYLNVPVIRSKEKCRRKTVFLNFVNKNNNNNCEI